MKEKIFSAPITFCFSISLSVLLTGCGQAGPLYLPQQPGTTQTISTTTTQPTQTNNQDNPAVNPTTTPVATSS